MEQKVNEVFTLRVTNKISQHELGVTIGQSNGSKISQIETGLVGMTDEMYNRIKGGIEVILKRRKKR